MSFRALKRAQRFIESLEINKQKQIAQRTAHLLTAWVEGKQLILICPYDGPKRMESPYDSCGQLWIFADNIRRWRIEGEEGGAA